MANNIIDRSLLELAESLNGYGMLIYVLITIIISAVLSALIGLERYRKGENAGMRTHALLAIGCSFLMTTSLWAFRLIPSLGELGDKYDVSRIAAAIVSGVGLSSEHATRYGFVRVSV